MQLKFTTAGILGCVLLSIGAGLRGDDTSEKRVLNPKDKSVKKVESNSTFGGYSKTSIFYLFSKKSAILSVVIDNMSKDFPATATIYSFPDTVKEEGLKKWVNNQTSDALFADAPEPTSKKAVGDGVFKIKKRKLVMTTSDRTGKYDKYEVEFKFAKMGLVAGFEIKSFSEKATVFLKQQ